MSDLFERTGFTHMQTTMAGLSLHSWDLERVADAHPCGSGAAFASSEFSSSFPTIMSPFGPSIALLNLLSIPKTHSCLFLRLACSYLLPSGSYPAPDVPSRGQDHVVHNHRYAQAAFANCGLRQDDLDRRRAILHALLASQSWIQQAAPVTATQVQDFVARTGRGRRMCCFCARRGRKNVILECARGHLN